MSDYKDKANIRRAGDVDLKSVVIIGGSGVIQDITPQVQGIELIENIFEPFTTGVITVADSIDLINVMPIVGQEVIQIDFATPTLGDEYRYQRTFCVYNCSDKIKMAERNAVYQLRIISQEAFIDKAMRVSKTFRGAPHEIARSLVFESGLQSPKRFYGEEASNDITFIANWWNPTKALDFCCRRALNENNSATYLFYETNSGFMFTSLDTLFKASDYQTFALSNYANQPSSTPDSTTTPKLEKDYQSILQIEYNNGFDVFDRLDTGYYGTEVIGFDGNTGQYIHAQAGKDLANETRLNQYSAITDKTFATTSSYIQYIPYVTQNFTGQNRGVFDSDLTYRAARQQFISRLSTNKATIRVYGRCDYFPGMIVYLSIPKDTQITKDTNIKEDLLVSGRYIVTSIKHMITTDKHRCNLQLMKDSYLFDITTSGVNPNNKPQTNTVASGETN